MRNVLRKFVASMLAIDYKFDVKGSDRLPDSKLVQGAPNHRQIMLLLHASGFHLRHTRFAQFLSFLKNDARRTI